MRNKSPSKFVFDYVEFVQIFNENQSQLPLILAQLSLAQAQVRCSALGPMGLSPAPGAAGHLGSHKAVLAFVFLKTRESFV